MRRNKKHKMKKTMRLVTAFLLILFAAMLIKLKLSDSPPEDELKKAEGEVEEESKEQEGEGEKPLAIDKEPEEIGKEPEEIPEDQEPGYGVLVSNPEKLDVLVNRLRNLPDTYVPEDLVTLSEVPTVLANPEVNQLRAAAYEALKELFQAAKDEEDFDLYARSGYRSYETQASLYSSYVANNGREAADKYSAKPGQSEHQTGLSIDITCEAMNYILDDNFGETDEGRWVAENAHRFGYIIRYPKDKEDITGYYYEPWHIRYLGTELAEKVYESGLTLEEYFE